MKKQTVRIISGRSKGRNIKFIDIDGLRPTPSRVRETLFSWLQFEISNKNCLDLFAGSGSLGFESVSRGAKNVTFVEKNTKMARILTENIDLFSISNAIVINKSFEFIFQTGEKFDIIFLDPPYKLKLLPSLLDKIKTLNPSLVYIEDNKQLEPQIDKNYYKILKQKKIGQIHFALLMIDL